MGCNTNTSCVINEFGEYVVDLVNEEFTFTIEDVIVVHEINEENIMYARRTDFVSDDIIYKAEAVPGTLDSEPKWRIRRVTLNAECDADWKWASGNDLFDKVWDDHLSLTYI